MRFTVQGLWLMLDKISISASELCGDVGFGV